MGKLGFIVDEFECGGKHRLPQQGESNGFVSFFLVIGKDGDVEIGGACGGGRETDSRVIAKVCPRINRWRVRIIGEGSTR